MSTVQEIEQAIRNLDPQDLAALRQWFAEFDAELWDHQLEQHVAAGRLDWLAEEARRDLAEGRCTDVQPEYDFRKMRGVLRGKYAARYRERLRVVRLAEDVATEFADEAAVNAALREYLRTHPSSGPSQRP